MSQELPEVDVEHVAAGLQHDVVVVAVADSQDVGRHAAAGARVDEVLHRLDRVSTEWLVSDVLLQMFKRFFNFSSSVTSE